MIIQKFNIFSSNRTLTIKNDPKQVQLTDQKPPLNPKSSLFNTKQSNLSLNNVQNLLTNKPKPSEEFKQFN